MEVTQYFSHYLNNTTNVENKSTHYLVLNKRNPFGITGNQPNAAIDGSAIRQDMLDDIEILYVGLCMIYLLQYLLSLRFPWLATITINTSTRAMNIISTIAIALILATLFYALHEETCLAVGMIAFIAGLDFCYGHSKATSTGIIYLEYQGMIYRYVIAAKLVKAWNTILSSTGTLYDQMQQPSALKMNSHRFVSQHSPLNTRFKYYAAFIHGILALEFGMNTYMELIENQFFIISTKYENTAIETKFTVVLYRQILCYGRLESGYYDIFGA
ncbi:hypothetical protein BCR42DRAFT_433866 [Absidia repens]|uniref:Uncharacterized protein n=1 Tax=Absidia repens TaxID=90262 RepID=A0A1X2IUR6_9FUNG|nr:hypothetical protein BCR42DRAFT_433866 [Absidia repens]